MVTKSRVTSIRDNRLPDIMKQRKLLKERSACSLLVVADYFQKQNLNLIDATNDSRACRLLDSFNYCHGYNVPFQLNGILPDGNEYFVSTRCHIEACAVRLYRGVALGPFSRRVKKALPSASWLEERGYQTDLCQIWSLHGLVYSRVLCSVSNFLFWEKRCLSVQFGAFPSHYLCNSSETQRTARLGLWAARLGLWTARLGLWSARLGLCETNMRLKVCVPGRVG